MNELERIIGSGDLKETFALTWSGMAPKILKLANNHRSTKLVAHALEYASTIKGL